MMICKDCKQKLYIPDVELVIDNETLVEFYRCKFCNDIIEIDYESIRRYKVKFYFVSSYIKLFNGKSINKNRKPLINAVRFWFISLALIGFPFTTILLIVYFGVKRYKEVKK